MYISQYMPYEYWQRILGKIDDNGVEASMPDRFQKDDDGNLVPLFPNSKNTKVEFRKSSNINLEKKPCGCMTNKIKQTESS